MHLGYLVAEFPGQTHAFFWRETQALSEQGFPIHCLSNRKGPLARPQQTPSRPRPRSARHISAHPTSSASWATSWHTQPA